MPATRMSPGKTAGPGSEPIATPSRTIWTTTGPSLPPLSEGQAERAAKHYARNYDDLRQTGRRFDIPTRGERIMALSEAELAFYREKGYVVKRGLFSRELI